MPGPEAILPQSATEARLIVTNQTPERYIAERERFKNSILLVLGSAGVGKSSMIPYLAEMTGMNVIKLDDKVEDDSGYTMEEMWDEEAGRGEPFFRLMESASFAKAVQPEGKGNILDAGGGLTDGDSNFAKIVDTSYLVAGRLTASEDEILRRLRLENEHRKPGEKNHRPWFPSNDDPEGQRIAIHKRLVKRGPRLIAATSFEVNTEGKTPRQVAALFRQNALRVIDKRTRKE